MFAELGGYVQVQGSPRAGVSVATYTNGGLSAAFVAKASPFTGNVILLGALTGPQGFYVLRQVNLGPPLSAGEITLGDEFGGLADFHVGGETSFDLLGLVDRGPIIAYCAAAACAPPAPFPAAWLLTLRYDLVYAKPGIS
jgi:hypothetical protein